MTAVKPATAFIQLQFNIFEATGLHILRCAVAVTVGQVESRQAYALTDSLRMYINQTNGDVTSRGIYAKPQTRTCPTRNVDLLVRHTSPECQ